MPFTRRPPPRVTSATVGSETRRVGDYYAADSLAQLAAALRPDNVVTIERVMPMWCAGYLEDFALPPEYASINALKAYLRDTYGGKTFKVTVLYPNGTPIWESRLQIDAPPRYDGRPIYKDTWGGERAPEPSSSGPKHAPAPMAAPQPSTASIFSDLKEVLGFAISFATQGSRERDEAMVNFMRESRGETRELVQALANRDAAQARASSFVGQLGEFMQAAGAIDEVRNVLAPPQERGASSDESMVEGAMKEAMKGFVGKAIANFSARPAGPFTRTRAPASAPARPPQGVNPGAIPDAVVTGQPRRG